MSCRRFGQITTGLEEVRRPRFSCYVRAGSLYLSRVNRLKPFVALIVLALWATCTIRCELVSLSSSETDACCETAPDKCPEKPAPANQCVCGLARSDGFIAAATVVSSPVVVDLPLFTVPAHLELPMHDPPSREVIFSPPELRTTWQFSFRTALSPRAPSFIS